MTGIYKITSPTGAVYIGQSSDINKRFNFYKRLACSDQPRIYNSLKKHTPSSHVFEVLIEFKVNISQSMIDYFEIMFINIHKESGFDMMNIKSGGANGKHSEETKEKIRQRFKGIPKTEQHIANLIKSKSNIKQHTKDFISKNHADFSFENHPQAKPVYQYDLNSNLIKKWPCTAVAARDLELSAPPISMCATGRNKTGHGYIWSYNEL